MLKRSLVAQSLVLSNERATARVPQATARVPQATARVPQATACEARTLLLYYYSITLPSAARVL